MAKYKFKYQGDSEVELPTHGKLVKPGEEVETDRFINNPDFKLISEQPEHKVEAKQEQPKEVVKEEEVK